MKFDIFGRTTLEVVRRGDEWRTFYCGNEGVKRKAHDVCLPSSLQESELGNYLADLFHEWATPEHGEVKRL